MFYIFSTDRSSSQNPATLGSESTIIDFGNSNEPVETIQQVISKLLHCNEDQSLNFHQFTLLFNYGLDIYLGKFWVLGLHELLLIRVRGELDYGMICFLGLYTKFKTAGE